MTQQGFPNISAPLVDPETGRINTAWFQLLISLWNRTGGSQGGAAAITGQIVAFAGGAAPDGWLSCDGSPVSRTVYSSLFGAIGTTWGAGDGSTTFNLPDLTDRFPVGAKTSPVGGKGGNNQIALSVANLPAHNHAITDPGHTHAVTDPGHTHTVPTGSSGTGGAATATAAATEATGSSMTGISLNNAFTGISTQNTGNGTPVNITPPYAAVLFVIKT